MKHSKIAICIDSLFCLLIMPLIIMLVPVDRWAVHNTAFLVTLILYLYTLYFIYRRAKIPSLFMRRKYIHILLLFIVLLTLTILLSHFPFPSDQQGLRPKILNSLQQLRIQIVWFFFLVVTGFSLSISLVFELFQQILSMQEIAAEKNKAELALYKAQINPHFLFNTLNTLYGLVLSKSDKTESAFVMFSNILRYMYTQVNVESIPLSNEIDYIRQYVDLQSLRLNKHTRVTLDIQTDDELINISPMILITFVENVFKYGTSADIDCTILIRIKVKKGNLLFETENTIMRDRQDKTSAIGIENCSKRLELLYPGRFMLTAIREGQVFRTQLTIQLL